MPSLVQAAGHVRPFATARSDSAPAPTTRRFGQPRRAEGSTRSCPLPPEGSALDPRHAEEGAGPSRRWAHCSRRPGVLRSSRCGLRPRTDSGRSSRNARTTGTERFGWDSLRSARCSGSERAVSRRRPDRFGGRLHQEPDPLGVGLRIPPRDGVPALERALRGHVQRQVPLPKSDEADRRRTQPDYLMDYPLQQRRVRRRCLKGQVQGRGLEAPIPATARGGPAPHPRTACTAASCNDGRSPRFVLARTDSGDGETRNRIASVKKLLGPGPRK
jgi:hypothetical protein